MRHYFLGFASGYSKKQRRAQFWTKGTEKDYFDLVNYIKKEYEARQVLVTRNGRSSIAAALKYYFDDRGEVIVNGLTCYAVIAGIKAAGMKPVFADVDRETLNFTVESLKKVLSEKTRAIIIQNTLGNMVEIKKIEKFAKEHKLVLIEDLAHCTGRKYEDGREAGTVGEMTIFTFGKDKVIDVVNGGAVAFRDSVAPVVKIPKKKPPMCEVLRARWYPALGTMCRGLSYVKLGGPAMQAMIKLGLVKRSAEGEIDYEMRRLSYFQDKLALAQLKKRHTLGKKPLREFYLIKNRTEVLKKLKKAGYYFDGFWFDKPVMPARYYKKANFPAKECPNATFVSEHIVNLPNYYSVKELKRAREIIESEVVDGLE